MRRAAWIPLLFTLLPFLLPTRSALAGGHDPGHHPDSLQLVEATIDQLQDAMESGLLTPEELVRLYLDRIAAYDQAGPGINADLLVNPNAEAEARALDDGPGHGGRHSGDRGDDDGSGRPVLQTGGSSSGPGIGVNANLAAVAIGTETSGSILSPASANGVVGLKPTLGLVSRDGILPITADQDTAGPITRTVSDAALVLGVIAGFDPAGPATAPCRTRGNCFSDYTRFLDKKALRHARIAVLMPLPGDLITRH